jgi:hypothetical protein
MRSRAEALGCAAHAHECGELFHGLPRASAIYCESPALARRGVHDLSNQPLTAEERAQIEARILALEIEHHDLDDVIARLAHDPAQDQLQLRRLKKKKLLLKDLIARLRDQLIPDIIA